MPCPEPSGPAMKICFPMAPRSARPRSKLARAERRGRAHVDKDAAARKACEQAIAGPAWPQHHRAHGLAVRKHRDHRFAALGRRLELARRLGSGRVARAPERVAIEVVRDDTVARAGEIAGHRMPHPAQAYEADARRGNDRSHETSLIRLRAGSHPAPEPMIRGSVSPIEFFHFTALAIERLDRRLPGI